MGSFIAANGLLLALATADAHSGCPNVCALTVQPPVVEPALACLHLTAEGQDCGCGIHLQISNACKSALGLPTDALKYCPAEWTSDTTCQVPSSHDLSTTFPLYEVGRGNWVFDVPRTKPRGT
jgi:hypothetical protein